MAENPPNVTQIPAPRVDFIDKRTGLMAREWYRFFVNLYNITGGGTSQVSTEDLQVSMDGSHAAQAQADVMQTALHALQSAPVIQEHVHFPRYGSFYDTTTQMAAAINTAYAITFNTTDLTKGVTIGSPTSRIYVDREGVYNIQFSAQLDNSSGGVHLAYIWLRVNGTDVPYSAGQVRLKGNDGELIAAWNYIYNFTAGDYFELMWAVADTSVQLLATAATAFCPAIPSVILTVTDNISK